MRCYFPEAKDSSEGSAGKDWRSDGWDVQEDDWRLSAIKIVE